MGDGTMARVVYARGATPAVFKTRANAAIVAGTPAAVWTPAAGKKVRLMGAQLSISAAGQIILKDGTAEIARSPQLAAAGVWSLDNIGEGILSGAADQVLNIDVSANASVGGMVWGVEE